MDPATLTVIIKTSASVLVAVIPPVLGLITRRRQENPLKIEIEQLCELLPDNRNLLTNNPDRTEKNKAKTANNYSQTIINSIIEDLKLLKLSQQVYLQAHKSSLAITLINNLVLPLIYFFGSFKFLSLNIQTVSIFYLLPLLLIIGLILWSFLASALKNIIKHIKHSPDVQVLDKQVRLRNCIIKQLDDLLKIRIPSNNPKN